MSAEDLLTDDEPQPPARQSASAIPSPSPVQAPAPKRPQPVSARWPRLLPICASVVAAFLFIGALTLLDGQRHPAPQVILSAGHAWDYVREVERAMNQAQQRIWVAMYVMRAPDQPSESDPVAILANAMVTAQERGVDVRICLDRSMSWEDKTQRDTKHIASVQYLRERGIRVIEDEWNRITHAKVVLIDDNCVFLGSHNWTYSALALNREVTLCVRDPETVRILESEVFGYIPGWDADK